MVRIGWGSTFGVGNVLSCSSIADGFILLLCFMTYIHITDNLLINDIKIIVVEKKDGEGWRKKGSGRGKKRLKGGGEEKK